MFRTFAYFTRFATARPAGTYRRRYKSTLVQSLKVMAPDVSQIVYPNLQAVLNVFNDEQYKEDPDIKELLKLFNETRSNACSPRVHPFIVIEGLDLSGKSTMTRILAKKINGVQLRTPPKFINSELRTTFDNCPDLKGAFYTLGNYMAAPEIERTLATKPVVLDRFWHSTAANALARTVQSCDFHLPRVGDEVYDWPADLIKPDIVIYLAVTEHERLRRQERRVHLTAEEKMLENNHKFRQNVILAYQYMKNPAVKVINGDASVSDTSDTLYAEIKHLLRPTGV